MNKEAQGSTYYDDVQINHFLKLQGTVFDHVDVKCQTRPADSTRILQSDLSKMTKGLFNNTNFVFFQLFAFSKDTFIWCLRQFFF